MEKENGGVNQRKHRSDEFLFTQLIQGRDLSGPFKDPSLINRCLHLEDFDMLNTFAIAYEF